MTIKIIHNPSKTKVLPFNFLPGKVYQAEDAPSFLVVGTRRTRLGDGCGFLMGIILDVSSTPWYEGDKEREFREVDIVVTVEN